MFPWSKKEQPKEEKKDISQAITNWVKQFPYQEEVEDEEKGTRQESKKQQRTQKQRPRVGTNSDDEEDDRGYSDGTVSRAVLKLAGLPEKAVTEEKDWFSDIAWWFFRLALYVCSPYIVFAYLETEVNKTLMPYAHQVVVSAAGMFAVNIALGSLTLLFNVFMLFLVETVWPRVSDFFAKVLTILVVFPVIFGMPLINIFVVAPTVYTAFGGHWTTFAMALTCSLHCFRVL